MTSKPKVKYPIEIHWKIPENELQELRNSANGFIGTIASKIPDSGVQFFFTVYPNGSREKECGKTYIFFHLLFEGKKEIKCEFSVSVETANCTQKFENSYLKPGHWGFSPCSYEELFDPVKRFFVDGEMVVKIEGFLMIEMDEKVFKLKGGSDSLGIELWNQDDSKDFVIVVKGKEIQVHKCILSTRSPVFAARLKPHTKESQEGKVEIPDFTFEVVEAAIKLCYHHGLVNDISLDDAMSILQFFDKYDIQSLKEMLEEHLILEISETNVCDLINCSLNSNSVNLQTKCNEFLRECLDKHKPINDFDTLNKEFALNFLKNSFSHISPFKEESFFEMV